MNFLEVVDEIIGITARPDKRRAIESGVNAIIAKICGKAEYYDDFVETTVAVDPTLYGQSFLLSTLTRFKKFQYIKPTGAKFYITPLGADKIFTPLNQIQPNRYFVGGTSVTFTLSALTPTLEVGYYQYPNILAAATDTHWLLVKAPWAVIDLTASRIFQSIGDDAAAKSYQSSGNELESIARHDFAYGYVPGV